MQAIIGNYAVPVLEEKQVWGTSDDTRTAYLDSQVLPVISQQLIILFLFHVKIAFVHHQGLQHKCGHSDAPVRCCARLTSALPIETLCQLSETFKPFHLSLGRYH